MRYSINEICLCTSIKFANSPALLKELFTRHKIKRLLLTAGFERESFLHNGQKVTSNRREPSKIIIRCICVHVPRRVLLDSANV